MLSSKIYCQLRLSKAFLRSLRTLKYNRRLPAQTPAISQPSGFEKPSAVIVNLKLASIAAKPAATKHKSAKTWYLIILFFVKCARYMGYFPFRKALVAGHSIAAYGLGFGFYNYKLIGTYAPRILIPNQFLGI